MAVPQTFTAGSVAHSRSVIIVDFSFLPRAGVKGAGAADWLRQSGIPIPASHNQWIEHRGGVVARLGHTEFLLESAADDDWTHALSQASSWPAQTVPVLRQDASLLLTGERVHELLAQTCSFRFASLQASPGEVVMTQMIGISIVAIAVPHFRIPAYRLWCDPSFGHSLWRYLEDIAAELCGGPLGLQQLTELTEHAQ
jgi:sarcosine oxidase gamma subunit